MSTRVPVSIDTIKLACKNYRDRYDKEMQRCIVEAKEKAMHGFWNYLVFRRNKEKIAKYYDNYYSAECDSYTLRGLEAITRVCDTTTVELATYEVEWIDNLIPKVK